MDKLKFTFQVKPTVDGKSSYIAITSIVTQDDKVFLIPEEYQGVAHHNQVQGSKAFATVKNTLKKRHQSRSVWIKITEDLLKTYFDEDGNIIFEDQFLEEVTQEQLTSSDKRDSEDPIVRILERLVESQQKREKQNVKKLADRFVVDKFDGKRMSAYHWMETFERECERFDLEREEEKIEIFRLFLERSCLDWYSSMMIRLGLQSEWSEWKSDFLRAYADKGWTSSKYALHFQYQSGSLLDYAVKKEKLLLEMRKNIDPGTLIDIIAAGLPDFVTDRINKEEIVHTKDLFNELGKLEHLVSKKKFSKKKDESRSKTPSPTIPGQKEKCGICERLKKGVRYHAEDSCWFRAGSGNSAEAEARPRRQPTKLINNAELEVDFLCEPPKN